MTDDLYYRKLESTSTSDLVDMLREKDRRIAELEEENEGLKAFESHRDEIEEDAKAIAKENAELKEKLEDTEKARDYRKNSSFDWQHKCTSRKPFKAAVKAQKQLSKAKELIEDMYDQIPSSHSDYYKDVMERAEQFLKELEK